MNTRLYIVFILLICFAAHGKAQVLDTLAPPDRSINRDTMTTQGPERRSSTQAPTYKISPNQPETTIDFGSRDSSYLYARKNQVHLFGEAFVNYEKYKLKAEYNIFDFEKNEAAAYDTIPGGIGQTIPSFDDGTNQFNAGAFRYNFDSKKGIIYNSEVAEGEFLITGSKTKYISKEADSVYTEDQVFKKGAFITTCNAPQRHYGIRSTKLKLIPNRLVVSGPSQLVIMGIPTPLFLPFGFYPLLDGISSGIIFPADFDVNPNLGLGVRGVGYYFPINDYMDLTATGDFYTRGTHRIYLNSNFRKRYKYNGSVSLKYANNIVENPEDLSRVSNKAFAFELRRTQDPKAHPYKSLSGSLKFNFGNFYAVNFNDYENTTRNQYGSNLNFRNTLPGTPLSLTVGIAHNQNTSDHSFNVTFPNAKLTLNRVSPFKRKVQTGGEKWYETINISGSSSFKTLASTTDTTLFTQETLDNIESGMYNTLRSDLALKLFKYINISPNVTANQYIYLKTLEKSFVDSVYTDSIGVRTDQDGFETILYDTTYGQVLEDYVTGLKALHSYRVGVTANTQFFGTANFSKGWLRGLRHTVKPSVNFSYNPDTKNRQQTVRYTNDPSELDPFTQYNPFAGGIYTTSLQPGGMNMSIEVRNRFEAKYYSKKDSTSKKFDLFRDVGIQTNYNFASDSLNWSPVSFNANTRIGKFTTVNLRGSFDIYDRDEDDNRINKSVWSSKKRPAAFRDAVLTINTNASIKQIRDMFVGGGESKNDTRTGNSQVEYSLFSMIENLRLSHNYVLKAERKLGKQEIKASTHILRLSGNIPLTPKWSVQLQNVSYDFVNSKFNYPSFAISRDLHCWQMSLSWYPDTKVYGFFIGVKSGALSFLKYNYGQQNTNRLGGGGFF